MITDAQRYFRGEDQFHTNQKRIRMKELFRRIVVKEWVMLLQESTCFRSHDKVLIVMCANLHNECWKKRYVIFHEPSVQMIVLKNEITSIKEKATSRNVEELKNHTVVHEIDESKVDSNKMLYWVQIARNFIKRAKKGSNNDIGKLFNTIRISLSEIWLKEK